MKTVVVLFALVVTVASQSVLFDPAYDRPGVKFEPAVGGPTVRAADLSPGLRVRFSVGPRPGTDFFFDIPRTISSAVKASWSLTPRLKGHLPSLSFYCHSDHNVCAFFDDTGNVAGLQIALEQSKLENNPFNMTITGFKEWEVTDSNGEVKKFWAISMYFVSEDYLKLSASVRKEKHDSSKLLQENAVWVTGFNGVIDKIPTEESELQKTKFTGQACVPWQGRHYFYDMRKDTECRADTIYPWFPLTHSGKVNVLGFLVIGKYPTNAGSRDWFEHFFRQAVTTSVPNGPECLYDLATNPGVTTMHVYFINRPWSVGCPLF